MTKEIEQLEDKRFAAMVAEDFKALEAMVHDELVYTHSSALVDTKASWLESMRSRKTRYREVKCKNRKVRVYGDVALAKGVCDLRNGQPGQMLDNHLDILWVLVKRTQGPQGWQIVARQTTRIGPSRGTPVASGK